MTDLVAATGKERREFLDLMRTEAGEVLEAAQKVLGISSQQFEGFVESVGRVCVIRHGDESAGFLWIEERDRVLHVHGIVVKQPFRGRGVATEALRLLEAQYSDSVGAVELGVHHANHEARALYEKLGYQTVHHVEDVGFDILRKAL